MGETRPPSEREARPREREEPPEPRDDGAGAKPRAPAAASVPAREARPIASALRTAAFRALFLAVLLACAIVSFVLAVVVFEEQAGWPPLGFWGGCGLLVLTCSAVGVPLAFVESFFARRPRTLGGDALAGGIVYVLALVGFFLAGIQTAYTFAVIQKGSVEGAADGVARFLQGIARDPVVLTVFLMPAAPFPPAFLARIHGLGLRRSALTTSLVGALLASPALFLNARSIRAVEIPWVLAAIVIEIVGCALVPALFLGADALERRVEAWLARAENLP